MPKKFQGENTKSAAARARKAEAKAAADAKRQQELEDAFWKDEDKHVMRKEQRKVCSGGGGAGDLVAGRMGGFQLPLVSPVLETPPCAQLRAETQLAAAPGMGSGRVFGAMCAL